MPADFANRYRAPVDPDDEIDMDLWMEMSDEEQERELAASMRELNDLYARLTPLQRYRGSRRSALRSCMNWRGIIRQNVFPDLAREQLRQAQIRLEKLRLERAFGIYPGDA